jgi:hypothetical protein
MPRIPLYNQGVGPTQGLAAGQLSPRASINAFTAPGRAFANYQKTFGDASKVAANFALAEQEREDVSINSKVISEATEKLNIAQLEASQTDTTIAQANASFKKASDGIIENVKLNNYGKRREAMLINNINKLLLQSKLNFQQNAFNNGNRIALDNYNSSYFKNLESLNGMNVDSFEWLATTESLLADNRVARESGIQTPLTEGEIISQINEKAESNQRLSLSKNIDSANSLDDLSTITSTVNKKIKDSAIRDILIQKISQKSQEITNDNITFLANTVDILDIGTNEFKGVVVLESQFNDVSNGIFADQAKQNLFNSLGELEKQQVIDLARKNLTLGRKEIEFQKTKEKNKQIKENEQEFIRLSKLKRNGDLTIYDVKNSQLTGVYGEEVKDQFLQSLTNELVTPPVTEESVNADRFIRALVRNNKLSSPTQRFITPYDEALGLEPRDDGYSLLEREGLHLSTQRVVDLESNFQLLNNKEYVSGLGQLDKSIEAFFPVVSPKLIGESPMGKVREFNFTMASEELYRKGIEDGKTSRQLLNPSSDDYIFTSDFINSFRATTQDIVREQMNVLKFGKQDQIEQSINEEVEKTKPSIPIELQPYAPPIQTIIKDLLSRGISEPSKEDIISHPEYQSWKASPNAKIFQNSINNLKQKILEDSDEMNFESQQRVVPRG